MINPHAKTLGEGQSYAIETPYYEIAPDYVSQNAPRLTQQQQQAQAQQNQLIPQQQLTGINLAQHQQQNPGFLNPRPTAGMSAVMENTNIDAHDKEMQGGIDIDNQGSMLKSFGFTFPGDTAGHPNLSHFGTGNKFGNDYNGLNISQALENYKITGDSADANIVQGMINKAHATGKQSSGKKGFGPASLAGLGLGFALPGVGGFLASSLVSAAAKGVTGDQPSTFVPRPAPNVTANALRSPQQTQQVTPQVQQAPTNQLIQPQLAEQGQNAFTRNSSANGKQLFRI